MVCKPKVQADTWKDTARLSLPIRLIFVGLTNVLRGDFEGETV